jgi:hypothetical protein
MKNKVCKHNPLEKGWGLRQTRFCNAFLIKKWEGMQQWIKVIWHYNETNEKCKWAKARECTTGKQTRWVVDRSHIEAQTKALLSPAPDQSTPKPDDDPNGVW